MENKNTDFKNSFSDKSKYLLKLYITGSASRSISAVDRVSEICKNSLKDYELQIIDVYENPLLAKEDQIIAIPTLVKVLPPPEMRVVGDMADTEKVLAGIGHI